MRSVSPGKLRGLAAMRLLAVGACVCLLGAGAAGCSTTQEKAAAKQIESEQILTAREVEEKAKKRAKTHHSRVGGPKTQGGLEKSARQHRRGEEG